jgi:spore maturation protein CgeB
MVFRISEALASHNLLFCMSVPGMHEFFVADKDFVEFTTSDDLVSKLIFYSKNPDLQKKIALSGYEAYKKFQKSKVFWCYINGKLVLA